MRIISHHNHYFIHTGCLVCGQRFELSSTAHDAYNDEEHLGAVCNPCVALTHDEMRATMHGHADALRADADELDALAEGPCRRECVFQAKAATDSR